MASPDKHNFQLQHEKNPSPEQDKCTDDARNQVIPSTLHGDSLYGASHYRPHNPVVDRVVLIIDLCVPILSQTFMPSRKGFGLVKNNH